MRILSIICLFLICFSLQAQEVVEAKPTARYYMEKARPKDKINSTFPYDIPLKTPDGDSLTSSSVFEKGKPTVFLFWLTTCFPCKMEMEAIASKMEGWKKEADFNVYAISTDFEHNKDGIKKRATEKNWGFTFLWDVNKEFKEIMPGGLNGLPQCFVLDKAGNIVYHKRKYSSGDEDIMFEEVKKIALAK